MNWIKRKLQGKCEEKQPLLQNKQAPCEEKQPLLQNKQAPCTEKQPLLQNKQAPCKEKQPLLVNKQPMLEAKQSTYSTFNHTKLKQQKSTLELPIFNDIRTVAIPTDTPFVSATYDVDTEHRIAVKIDIYDNCNFIIKLLFIAPEFPRKINAFAMNSYQYDWLTNYGVSESESHKPPHGEFDFLEVTRSNNNDIQLKVLVEPDFPACKLTFNAWKKFKTIIDSVQHDVNVVGPCIMPSRNHKKQNIPYVEYSDKLISHLILAIAKRRFIMFLYESCDVCRYLYEYDLYLEHFFCESCRQWYYVFRMNMLHDSTCKRKTKWLLSLAAYYILRNVKISQIVLFLRLHNLNSQCNYINDCLSYRGRPKDRFLQEISSERTNIPTLNEFKNKLVNNDFYAPLAMHMLHIFNKERWFEQNMKWEKCQIKKCHNYFRLNTW